MNAANIAARIAHFYDEKEWNESEKNTKRVLHETVVGLNDFFQVAEEWTKGD